MKVVKAKMLGFYGNTRRKPGDVFVLTSEKHFSEKWMEPADHKSGIEQEAAKEVKPSKPKARVYDEVL